MQGVRKARWQELCEQAALEQDPAKLLGLAKQINHLLAEKQERVEERQSVVATVSDSCRGTTITRILLADDSFPVRSTIKALLADRNPAWEIREAETASETLAKVIELQPSLVILDLSLPDGNGQEIAREIRQLSPSTKIIICSFDDSSLLAMMAEYASADGYFEKGSSSEDLHKTIASVLGGDK